VLAGYTATLVGQTATFTAAELTDQTLQITEDLGSGFLMNNRFAAGDPGFASPFDFDSSIPGVQRLVASPASTIIVSNSNNDSILLGSDSSAASSLLAHILLGNTGPAGGLGIQDGARVNRAAYTINSGGITTDDQAVNVTLLGGTVFSGGISLVTGGENNDVTVLGTRAGEGLTLNSNGGQDDVNVGAGNTQNILGSVTVDNDRTFSDLIVDNSQGVNASTNVTVSGTSIVGVAPAPINFSNLTVDDIDLHGGTNGSTYLITGVNGGSTLSVETGGGNDVFYVSSAVGNTGTLNGLRNGTLLIDAGGGSNFLVASDAGRQGPDTVTLTDSTIADTALRYFIGYQATGGTFAGVNLANGPGAVRVNVQSTVAGAITGVINMGGDDTIDVSSDTVTNMGDLSGLAGPLSVIAAGGTDLLVISEAGRRTGDAVVVTATGLGSGVGAGFTVYYTAAGGTFTGINFAAGSGDNRFAVQGTPAGVPVALYTGGGNNLVNVGVTPDSGYALTVVGGPSGGGGGSTVLGVADLTGSATIDNVASGPGSGVVQVLYVGRKRSRVAYFGVDQVFTDPAAN
jgi:hypothetical protein